MATPLALAGLAIVQEGRGCACVIRIPCLAASGDCGAGSRHPRMLVMEGALLRGYLAYRMRVGPFQRYDNRLLLRYIGPYSPVPSARLWCAPEVARRLGVSKSQVYLLVRKGLLPAVRVGRHLRFSGGAVEAWIEAGGAALPERRG